MKLFGMRFFDKAKDGGPESTVTGWWLFEIKKLASVALLRFADGSRDAFHSHAFRSLNWVLRGRVVEETLGVDTLGNEIRFHTTYKPSWRPVYTARERVHKVVSDGDTWVLSLRGRWADTWLEFLPGEDRWVTLTHGRKEVV